jgi:hypothetical protein
VQVLYLLGPKNFCADFLSRPPPSHWSHLALSPLRVEAVPVDFEAMATEQNCCAETRRLLGGSSLKLAFRQAGAKRLVGDVSTGVFHPIVPAKFQKDIFLHLHSISFWEAGLSAPCIF